MLVLRVQLRCSTSNLQTKNLHGCKRRMTIVNGSPALRLPYAHGGGVLGRDPSHRRPGNSNPLTSGAKSCTEPDIRQRSLGSSYHSIQGSGRCAYVGKAHSERGRWCGACARTGAEESIISCSINIPTRGNGVAQCRCRVNFA